MKKGTGDGFYAYLLECGDGTLYAGWTTNPDKRLQTHNAGMGAKYTRARLPVRLAKFWSFTTRTEAMQFEAWLKKQRRSVKMTLIHKEP